MKEAEPILLCSCYLHTVPVLLMMCILQNGLTIDHAGSCWLADVNQDNVRHSKGQSLYEHHITHICTTLHKCSGTKKMTMRQHSICKTKSLQSLSYSHSFRLKLKLNVAQNIKWSLDFFCQLRSSPRSLTPLFPIAGVSQCSCIPQIIGPADFLQNYTRRIYLRKSAVQQSFVDLLTSIIFIRLFVRLHGDISIYLHRIMF